MGSGYHILIILLSVSGGSNFKSQEFFSKETCEIAAKSVMDGRRVDSQLYGIRFAYCVKK